MLLLVVTVALQPMAVALVIDPKELAIFPSAVLFDPVVFEFPAALPTNVFPGPDELIPEFAPRRVLSLAAPERNPACLPMMVLLLPPPAPPAASVPKKE